MIILELRIPMPMTSKEYQVGMLYGVAQASLEETGGGEGVEVLNNEPYTDHPLMDGGRHAEGQYTKKIYHLEHKVPTLIKHIAPKGSLQLHEEAWNAHPEYCRTVITNPGYMKENFTLKIETLCVDNDRGELENAHELPKDKLAKRKVVKVDIASEKVQPDGFEKKVGTTLIDKTEPQRGPLTPGWIGREQTVMTVYKLVTIEFKWFGLQGTVENFIAGYEEKLFAQFHRKIWCWSEKWFGMSLEDIRKLEDKTKDDLKKQMEHEAKRGTMVVE